MVGKRVKSHVAEKMIFSIMIIIIVTALSIFVGAIKDIRTTSSYLAGFEEDDLQIKELKTDLAQLAQIPSCQTDFIMGELNEVHDSLELKEDLRALYSMQLVTMRDVNITKLTIIELMMLSLIAILALTVIMVRVYEKVE